LIGLDFIGVLETRGADEGTMAIHFPRLAMVAALAATTATSSFGQTGNWQVDSAHSTASLSLVSSSNATRPLNIAIAKVAGILNLNESRTSGSSLRLSIYPADQDSSLLNRDGTFRQAGLAALSRYTIISFRSKSASVTHERKIEFTGDLTVTHVRRETNIAWTNSYTGSVPTDAVEYTVTREITFVVDVSNLPVSREQGKQSEEITALATVQRSSFPKLLAVLRDSNWPVVVLDKECQMPYYPALNLRDYSGASCSGTQIEVKPSSEPPYYFAADNIGAGTPAPPAGDQVTILAHLHLESAASGAPGGSHN
jgi:polyisoprenoid-binding protein YceI